MSEMEGKPGRDLYHIPIQLIVAALCILLVPERSAAEQSCAIAGGRSGHHGARRNASLAQDYLLLADNRTNVR